MYKVLIPIQPFIQEQHINYYDSKNNLIGTDTCTLKNLPSFCNQLDNKNEDLAYIFLTNYPDFSRGIADKIRAEVSDSVKITVK